MVEIKLSLDEEVSHTAAVVLRSRGYDVVSAHEVGVRGKSDDGSYVTLLKTNEPFLLVPWPRLGNGMCAKKFALSKGKCW